MIQLAIRSPASRAIRSPASRLEREGGLDSGQVREALDRLDQLAAAWLEVTLSDRVRQAAQRLLRVHALRAGDALQLAAAVVAADGDPRSLAFVTLDARLAGAAEREGFPVLQPSERAPAAPAPSPVRR